MKYKTIIFYKYINGLKFVRIVFIQLEGGNKIK